MKITICTFYFLLTLLLSACSEPVTYLGGDIPGLIPKLYAPGIVNLEGRFQQNLSMSPDGSEQYFTVTDSAVWRYECILRVRTINKGIVIDTPQFVLDFQFEKEWFIGEALIAPDNETCFLWQITLLTFGNPGEWKTEIGLRPGSWNH